MPPPDSFEVGQLVVCVVTPEGRAGAPDGSIAEIARVPQAERVYLVRAAAAHRGELCVAIDGLSPDEGPLLGRQGLAPEVFWRPQFFRHFRAGTSLSVLHEIFLADEAMKHAALAPGNSNFLGGL